MNIMEKIKKSLDGHKNEQGSRHFTKKFLRTVPEVQVSTLLHSSHLLLLSKYKDVLFLALFKDFESTEPTSK